MLQGSAVMTSGELAVPMPSGLGRDAAVEAADRASGWLPGFASALHRGRAGPGGPDAESRASKGVLHREEARPLPGRARGAVTVLRLTKSLSTV